MELVGLQSALKHRDQIVFAHDEQFLAIDLDLGAGILAEQHLVTGLDRHRADLAVFLDLAGAHGDHFALDRLFGRGVGDDDAAGGLGFRLEALDDDAVVQWTKLHDDSSCVGVGKRVGVVSTQQRRVLIVGPETPVSRARNSVGRRSRAAAYPAGSMAGYARTESGLLPPYQFALLLATISNVRPESPPCPCSASPPAPMRKPQPESPARWSRSGWRLA